MRPASPEIRLAELVAALSLATDLGLGLPQEHVLRQTVIATLGSEGAAYLDRDQMILVPGRKVDVVDTTGAGDCFVGALAAALSEGVEIQQALVFANAAASLSVQVVGASASMPTREVVDDVLAKN